MGQYVSIAASDGSGRFDAYLALPASGKGPGVVIGQEIFGVNANMRAVADLYAEEGYVALVPDLFWRLQPGVDLGYDEAAFAKAIELFQRIDLDAAVDDIAACIEHLRQREEVVHAGIGFVGFCMGGKLAYLAATRTDVSCSVGYYGMGIEALLDEAKQIKGRLVLHFAEQDAYCPQQARDAILPCLRNLPKTELYLYPGVDHAFARVGGMHFDKPAYLMAHERSIAALKREIGPNFDLSALWDEHVRHEFDTRDVAATMATMVAEPYVNHVPTLTGGVGQRELSRFYRHHFIHGNPPDMTLTPISRTVGALQVVDEFVMRFTHSCEIDWLLPGVPPTGRFVEIPMLGVVRFRGDHLYHEHIYWDQAGVLVQIGLLDPQGLPVAGVESARKLLDESLPSNRLMARWAASEGLGL
ncbi:dienelactone hydrolase family protein [Pseudomonas aeruginosa]|uniref:dienelactone hydrolase family protein n=1 Tax=Pseudomonas aeruginosa TaxID=287 RepID=UPI00053E2B07|nr:dienelactone hydrolase family protein [Pseudomonas aeruginosa]EKV0901065.1 dienelactone hydrolase family protein [Pseudomonas aeruginosa]EKX8762119.1 dienelactone hydrolase family protein [Pseudomonas aeruginosa]KSQ68568.1 carboxymethylenebutenolidase [Pseudomonas aeruginosa]POP58453.1 dienelactone hydrolase family protein [Pseudomonas aeruginosa]RQE68280.1 dienelactone hydrolase family protein [Pseudomonas aeruginosa]